MLLLLMTSQSPGVHVQTSSSKCITGILDVDQVKLETVLLAVSFFNNNYAGVP